MDFEYFLDNLSTLNEKYPGMYVAIKDKSILGAYDSMDDAVFETVKSTPLGTFLVQKCVDSAEELTAHYAGNVSI